MIQDIRKYQQTNKDRYVFSLLIPSWNNLEYLKLCVGSIRKNSRLDLQIIVIANEGKDGTLEWLKNQPDIDFVHAETNIGICYGLNIARSLIKSDYVVYVNDDMYLLPDWDTELKSEIDSIGHKSFMLSATLIEPNDTGNSCVVVKDFGSDLESFREADLLKEYRQLSIPDWNGSTWPPNVVHIDLWDLVGGLSIEFSPGMYSDPDLSRKLYEAGVRYFKGKGNSLVYHFGSKSTRRVRKNTGRKTFLMKWGITSKTFTDLYLKKGEKFSGSIAEPKIDAITQLINKLKRLKNSL
ncbi:MAG: glycosyltransferase [Bacteroidales bacterium]|nr:glycosyltransferase [Bacteroidales bacterium]